MEDDLGQMSEDEICAASAKVQDFLMQTATNPGDGVGIAAMILVNFLASGVACGAIEEHVIKDVIDKINTAIWETVAQIRSGNAQTTETVQ